MKKINYTEQLQTLSDLADKNIIEVYNQVANEIKPQKVKFVRRYDNQVIELNSYEIPIREYKTRINGCTAKISAIGYNSGSNFYYLRTYITNRPSYQRIGLMAFDVENKLKFVDHLNELFFNHEI